MLYHLLYPLHKWHVAFNVFRYITFRTIYAIITAGLIVFFLMPPFIRFLRKRQFGQVIREVGPDHAHKAGTPTMGGVVITAAVVGTVLLWGNLTNLYLWLALGVFTGFAAIGFYDDWRKVNKKR
ncbi:MAG: phospho-N-acetylmuramoyl-pentapeptide-transferase, partial [Thermodesulfobacteria bacterium]|nr:phospho-N-acetylmuramoyl-pentapeptide-transferase [Thermodesulfobacteriota bacterium]